ncbi:MAG: topoisomerase [Glaciihabitans sp.]|nr:topoisomerase [Glaciihabitans sp.]
MRAGRGFSYRDAAGHPVQDSELRRRIEALAIPPAWTDVWISPYPNGHIQATGVDAAGRRQYIYHPTWREQKDRIKYDRALALAESLPTARRQVTIDLRSDGPTRLRALATGFRMLDTGSLRIGSERYADQHGSFGLTTLLCAHVTVRGDTVELKFPAKSGQAWESDITDPDLARVVRALKRRGPTAHLLAFRDEQGWHPVDAAEINAYVRERTGGDFTAKDFRTLHGTLAAAASLARHGPATTKSQRAKALAQAMRDASAVLGNTPAIAKSSYVDPRVVDYFAQGRTLNPERLNSAESELRAMLYE